ncbi:MAG: glutamate decarboxylase [Peptococcaceae bacterium]|jgi:Ethanolamine utilization protein EutJ (predicted chaperonin)|nr:glutamate decarboxylase [Peptococcaceae bacterium]MDR2737154.1 glutamate decarboxylase [Gracilibacteraceae bacterium]
MWTVIYIAPNVDIAEQYKKHLTDESIFVQLRPVSGNKNKMDSLVEILVSQSEAEEAHEILTNLINRS